MCSLVLAPQLAQLCLHVETCPASLAQLCLHVVTCAVSLQKEQQRCAVLVACCPLGALTQPLRPANHMHAPHPFCCAMFECRAGTNPFSASLGIPPLSTSCLHTLCCYGTRLQGAMDSDEDEDLDEQEETDDESSGACHNEPP